MDRLGITREEIQNSQTLVVLSSRINRVEWRVNIPPVNFVLLDLSDPGFLPTGMPPKTFTLYLGQNVIQPWVNGTVSKGFYLLPINCIGQFESCNI